MSREQFVIGFGHADVTGTSLQGAEKGWGSRTQQPPRHPVKPAQHHIRGNTEEMSGNDVITPAQTHGRVTAPARKIDTNVCPRIAPSDHQRAFTCEWCRRLEVVRMQKLHRELAG